MYRRYLFYNFNKFTMLYNVYWITVQLINSFVKDITIPREIKDNFLFVKEYFYALLLTSFSSFLMLDLGGTIQLSKEMGQEIVWINFLSSVTLQNIGMCPFLLKKKKIKKRRKKKEKKKRKVKPAIFFLIEKTIHMYITCLLFRMGYPLIVNPTNI